ncbi:MAG: hypothetical protein CTY23_12170 [Methylomonas sp.]|nr:MAG: hypothetical protein CTY23_12170 [Methylomonas sp.]
MIACLIHRDFSPAFASVHAANAGMALTRQELQDVAEHIRREFTPSRSSRPAQLVLLPVSPTRLHVYWHITAADVGADMRWILRLYQQATSPTPAPAIALPAAADEWLDLIVEKPLGQTDILLSGPAATGMSYRATLAPIAGHSHSNSPLHSKPAHAIVTSGDNPTENLPPALAAFLLPALPSTSSFAQSSCGQGYVAPS